MEKEDWFRKPRDEMMGEEVMVMPQMGAVTSAKPILPTNLNSTSYLNEAKANADADPSAPPHDSLRTFYYEGTVQLILCPWAEFREHSFIRFSLNCHF